MSGGTIAITIIVYLFSLLIALGFKCLDLRMFLVITITYWVSIWVLKAYRIIGAAKGANIAKQTNKEFQQEMARNKRIAFWLGQFEKFSRQVGFPVSEEKIFEWNFIIKRTMKPIKAVNRLIKAEELLGLLKAITFCLVLICVFGFIYTFSVAFIIIVMLSLSVQSTAKTILVSIIQAQDRELEHDFPSLYLLLYCQLLEGNNAKIGPILADYTRSTDAIYKPDEKKVIREFVKDLRMNIEIYSDESIAIQQMREKYKSALVINFVNLAVQALRGADTKDKLLAFKMELSAQQVENMNREAQARVDLATKSIFCTYVILFEFVVVSWAAKLLG